MTPTGHTLTGIAIGLLVLPAGATAKRRTIQLAAFGAVANLPDFPFPGWGHDAYAVSHSIFVNLLLIGGAAALLGSPPEARARLGGWPVLTAGALALLSHLLLDSFYNHGQGVAIFWPFSPARLSLPVPWFAVVPGPEAVFTAEMARETAVELLVYSPLIVLSLLVGRARGGRQPRRSRRE